MRALIRKLFEILLAVGMWGWLATLVMIGTGLGMLRLPDVLWGTTPGLVTADGERVSYAARGRELSFDPFDPPPSGTRVTVYYNPLLPRFATLDPSLDIPLPQAVWLPPVALGWTTLAAFGLAYKLARHNDPITHEVYVSAFNLVGPLAWLACMAPLTILLASTGANISLLSPPLPRLFSALVGALLAVTGVLLVAGPYPTLGPWLEALFEEDPKQGKRIG